MITPLQSTSNSLAESFDVFIASASFEKRCLSIYENVKSKIKFTYKLVSFSSPHLELIKDNLQVFLNDGFKKIEVNNANQILTVTNISSVLHSILLTAPNANFLVDITTFTRQTLLILFRLLRNFLTSRNEIQFLYTPAKEYSIGLSDDEKWLSKGVLGVYSVFGYSGIIRPSNPYHLIILMGYEVERASSLISEYEPSKVSIGYAGESESISCDHYKLNKSKFDQLLDEFPFAESFEFSATKINDCKYAILKQMEKYSNYNIIVAPMNNKISTLACAFVAFERDDVQLATAIPAIYNPDYSIPSENCYIVEMPKFIKNVDSNFNN